MPQAVFGELPLSALKSHSILGLTNGIEVDPKEARRKVETAWQMAKEKGWLIRAGD